jgi:SSS family solute:Na+ symporter
MTAALLAALMSTIAAALNSISTLVAFDIVKRYKPSTPDKTLIRTGQISAVVVMILSVLWSTQGGKFSSIFEAINKIPSALAPPIATVLLFGVFSRWGTRRAGFYTLVTGFVLGATCFCFDFEPISGKMYLTRGLGMPFMMQNCCLFLICTAVYITVSVFSPKPDVKMIESCTWKNPAEAVSGKFRGVSDVRLWSVALLITLITLYTIFR